MRILLVAVLSCMLITGCVDRQDDSGAETNPATAPVVSADTSIGAGMRPDDPALPHADASGQTPDAVLLALIDAQNSSAWETAYSLYATPEVDFETASRAWTESNERYEDFTIREIRIIEPETAVVRVTYEARTTPPDSDAYPVVVDEPGEWWAVLKVDGVWKVKWMPRQ